MYQLNLCNFNYLDSNYTNVIDFANKDLRNEYFAKKTFLKITVNVKPHAECTSICVPIPLQDLDGIDYLFYDNLYYFVTNKTYITKEVTELSVQLDVFNTYHYDIKHYDSFVERCHYPRWNGNMPHINTLDEGLPLGEYTINQVLDIAELNQAFIASSTTPLGVNDGIFKPPIGGGGGGGLCPPEPDNPGLAEWKKPFISMLYPGACQSYNEYNFFASVKIAQAILESGWGKSDLAINAFNFFGIKWQDYMDADYYVNPLDGIKYIKYPSASEGIYGHTKFLLDNPRYTEAGVFTASNPRAQAEALQRAGYAGSSTTYADQLMEVIESNNLTIYDIKGGSGIAPGQPIINNEGGRMGLPTYGEITAKFPSYPSGGQHNGTDIAPRPHGSTAYSYAMQGGKVTIAGLGTGGMASYGYLVEITHGEGVVTRYAHHKAGSLLVKVGDTVQMGQRLGTLGSTGNSTGVHLHIELLIDRVRKDALPGYKYKDVIKKWD